MEWQRGLEDWIAHRAEEIVQKAQSDWLKANDGRLEALKAAADSQAALLARQEQFEERLRVLQERLESVEHVAGAAGDHPMAAETTLEPTESVSSSPMRSREVKAHSGSEELEQERPVLKKLSPEPPSTTQPVRHVSLSPTRQALPNGEVRDEHERGVQNVQLHTLDAGDDEESEPEVMIAESIGPAAAAQSMPLVKATVFMLFVAVVVTFPKYCLNIFGCTAIWLTYFLSTESIVRQISASTSCCTSRYARFAMVSLSWSLRQLTHLRKKRRGARIVKCAFTLFSLLMVLPINSIVVVARFYLEDWQFGVLLSIWFIYLWNGTPLWIYTMRGSSLHLRKKSGDIFLGFQSSEGVKKAAAHLKDCVEEAKRWRGSAAAEHSAIEILSQLERDDLSELLEKIPQDLLNAVLKTFPETVPLLCLELADVLSPAAKARLIDSLMNSDLSNIPTNRIAMIEQILLNTQGDDLTIIKCIQDDRGNNHSMRNLLWQTIPERGVRDRILAHFLTEAMAQIAHRTLLESGHFTRLLRKATTLDRVHSNLHFMVNSDKSQMYDGHSLVARRKIVFDVDDTMECSAGQHYAGIDKRYPHRALYPGFLALLKELHAGDPMSQMAALSARPGPLEDGLAGKFRKLKEQQGLHGNPALLLGELASGLTFVMQGGDLGHKALAETKIKRMKEYLRLYPEFRFIFMGDNGQGDYAVGNWMYETFPDSVEQVFIHKVQDVSKTFLYDSYQAKNASAPIAFVEDWVSAAVLALERERPLIELDGLKRVVEAAEKDFNDIPRWDSDEQKNVEKARLWGSIRRAKAVLRGRGFDMPRDAVEDAEEALAAAAGAAADPRSRRLVSQTLALPHTASTPAMDSEKTRKWSSFGRSWFSGKEGASTTPASVVAGAAFVPCQGDETLQPPPQLPADTTGPPPLPSRPVSRAVSPELRASPLPPASPPPGQSGTRRFVPGFLQYSWNSEAAGPEQEGPGQALEQDAAAPPRDDQAGLLEVESPDGPSDRGPLERFESLPDLGAHLDKAELQDERDHGCNQVQDAAAGSINEVHRASLRTNESFVSAGALNTSESGGSLAMLESPVEAVVQAVAAAVATAPSAAAAATLVAAEPDVTSVQDFVATPTFVSAAGSSPNRARQDVDDADEDSEEPA